MQRNKIRLSRLISVEDIISSFGEWKLHSPEMFSVPGTNSDAVPLDQAMQYLKDEIMGRIRERQNIN